MGVLLRIPKSNTPLASPLIKEALDAKLIVLADEEAGNRAQRYPYWGSGPANALTFEDCFNPTYELLRCLLTPLNPAWPAGTCLNEDI